MSPGRQKSPQVENHWWKGSFPEEEGETDTQVNSDGYKEGEREEKAEIPPGFLGGGGKGLDLSQIISSSPGNLFQVRDLTPSCFIVRD